MKFGVFLICSLLFAGSYVQSRSLPQENGEYSAALDELKVAEEFLESALAKINNIKADSDSDEDDYETSNLKRNAEYAVQILQEVIKLGPSKAIEVAEGLSEVVELIHQASELGSNGDGMKEALNKLESAEETITQVMKDQQDVAVKYIRYMVDIINGMKAKVDANPDNLLEQFKDTYELPQMIGGAPKYLSKLLKKSFFEMIEQLWSVDMAIESMKAAHPSEAEQLKKILRKAEDKMNTLRKDSKKLAAKITLTIAVHVFPDESIMHSLNNLDEDYAQDKISIAGQMTISEDDPQLEECRTKMIEMGEMLEGANPQILEHMDDVIELVKTHFPEENQLDGLVDEMKIKVSELKDSIKSIVDKIKLDAAEGLKTNCLYALMFANVLKDKFDVYLRNLGQVEEILSALQMELPDDEARTSLEEATDKLKDLANSESDSFNKFLQESASTFYVFGIGMGEVTSIPDETDVLSEMGGL